MKNTADQTAAELETYEQLEVPDIGSLSGLYISDGCFSEVSLIVRATYTSRLHFV
jgi:hypothetical protein